MNNEIHILVVEDSLTQAEKLKFILEKDGYRVSTAEDGVEALEKIKKFECVALIAILYV